MISSSVLKKLYVIGSLKQEKDQFSFQLSNNIYPVTVIGVEPLKVDGINYEPSQASIKMEDKTILGNQINKENVFKFERGKTFTIFIKGKLQEGAHKFIVAFNVKGLGKISFEFEDKIK